MKTLHIKLLASVLTILGACSQDVIELEAPETTPPETTTPSKGSADFTKFVSIGNSLTAGYQAGALFTEGQQNSLPLILSKQFSLAQGTTLTFNQPDINSDYGYYGVAGSLVLGRLILYDADGTTGTKTTAPAPAGTPGMPAPYSKGGDLPKPFTGDKTKLNNFAVPGILLAQILTPATGGPANTSINPAYNPLYARFASSPSPDGTTGSTILGDAIAAQPTFFLLDIGNNDILGYATNGGDNAGIQMTSEANFQGYYSAATNSLLGSNANRKGVIATIPDVTTIPYFLTVLYNAIPLDAATAAAVNSGFSGYNQVIDAIKGNPNLLAAFGPASDLDARKVSFSAATNNRILISDEELKDLGGAFDALAGAGAISAQQRAALEPYRKVRQATSTDLITLSAGAVLGTTVGGNASAVNGVSVPLSDKYVLIPKEISDIKSRTSAFNTIIKNIADNSSGRLALADVNSSFTALVTAKAGIYNGVAITPNFAPPTGAFSEDGVHPNSRGYAFMANIFIDAINAKFSANVPKASLADYKGTGLPVNGN